MVTTYLSRPGHCTHLARLQAKILFKVAILFLFCFVFFLPPNLFFKLFEELKPNHQSVGIRVEESGLGMGRRAFRLTSVSSGGTRWNGVNSRQAAMFDFYINKRLVRGRNVYHGLERRSKRGGGGRGGAMNITLAWGHSWFGKLCSPTNGVADWCGLALLVNH